jgi:hypothetical protein
MATELTELKEMVARVDERTQTILTNQENLAKTVADHETRDRQDFKEVHSRINRVERRQNWFLGVGTTVVFCVGVAVTAFKALFGA